MIAFFSLKRGITTEINCDLTKKAAEDSQDLRRLCFCLTS